MSILLLVEPDAVGSVDLEHFDGDAR